MQENVSAARLAARREVAQKSIEQLRKRLLDLSNRNRLLNFRFSDRSRTHVRVIDELPDVLYSKLVDDGKRLTFTDLPEPQDEPQDEKSEEFLGTLQVARVSDETYLSALQELDENDDDASAVQRIERSLKDRVRTQLGLTPRPTHQSLTPAAYARTQDIDPSYDLPRPQQNGQGKASHLDDSIQTLLFPEQMERKLAGIRDNARTVLSEMGVNVLYSAFGYLEWYESDISDSRFFAPLLLHPLEMERRLVRHTYRYSIISTGDDSEVNLTLKERLLSDFGLALPDFNAEAGDTPEHYWVKVEEAIQERQRWSVRRFVTIGIFAFGRLAMYHDLDPERWPDDRALHLHPVLVELLGGSDSDGALYAQDYDVDESEIAAKVPLIITDADSSQFAAIADVMDGKNLAIKGPPGTGKSQTITNIIAAALAKKMKVLFIAEKMAALEVVKKRLDDAGLGEFCLELHSTKAHKQDVLSSLRKRMELQSLPAPPALTDTIAEHERLRKQLTRYVELINQPFGQIGKSLQELFWAGTYSGARARELDLPVNLNDVVLADTLRLTAVALDSQRESLAALEKCAAAFLQLYGTTEKHPWTGMLRADLSPFAQRELLQAFAAWCETLLTLEKEAKSIETEFGLQAPTTLDGISRLVRAFALLPEDAREIAADALPKLQNEDALSTLEQFCEMVLRWQELHNSLTSRLQNPDRLPDAETIRALEAERSILTVGDRLFTGKVSELATFVKHRYEFSHLVEACIALARRLFQSAGVHAVLTVLTLRTVLEAIEMLRSTPRAIMLKRSAPLLDETARSVLEEAARDIRLLRDRHQALNMIFSFSIDERPQDYRRHAAILRTTGFFGRLFSRDFKHACAAWHGARKGAKKVPSVEMAKELEILSEHLDAVRKFCGNDRLKTTCGKEFDGLATDFDILLMVNDFARQVEHRFPSVMPGHRDVRRFLLDADRTTLDAVLAEAGATVVLQLQTFCSTLEGSGEIDEKTELDAAYGASLQVASKAEQLHHACKQAGLHDDVILENLSALADDLAHFAQLTRTIEGDEKVQKLLGMEFLGVETDVKLLACTAALCRKFQAHGLPQATLDWFFATDITLKLDRLQHMRRVLDEALERQTQTCHVTLRAGDIDQGVFFGAELTEIPLATAVARLERALAAHEELPAWVDYNRLRVQIEEMGLKPILKAYETTGTPFTHLVTAFEHVFYRTILKQAYTQYPELARFSGVSQEALRRRFQDLDRTIISLKRRQLTAELVYARISAGRNWGQRRTWTDRHLIEHEIGKQKRHIPLRDLFRRAGTAIQQMKPCWMMSPASVAQFIQPGGATFDLVVIDEASQMKPEDALGATGRSRQLVVVGDPQQLPPTAFFDRMDMPNDDDDQDDNIIDNESVLDLALSVFRPARELRWHYRSRHESLIAFSNKHFYDGKLVVFPSPLPQHDDYGVEYRKVDGLYTPKAGVNLLEARTVVEAAAVFMSSYPTRSLGIVTLNQAQREVLTEEMDRLFAHNDHAESYRKRWEGTLEPFFVKNLENVQGDERDVIFISTVYGPEQHGSRVAQRFGPINAATGHRRLNVLFTRAKEKVILFSSMTSEDVIPTATSRLGVGILKQYLAYARDRRLDTGTPSGRAPDSDFEVFVANRLAQHGFDVVPQVGVAGYFIDLSVRDPRRSNYYLLGIECDGATYHSAKSARDRDRLRQEILEQMGWNIYRIWSTDWLSNPGREIEKLLHHIQVLTQNTPLIDHVPDRGTKTAVLPE